MCAIKIYAFTSIGRPPSWSGTGSILPSVSFYLQSFYVWSFSNFSHSTFSHSTFGHSTLSLSTFGHSTFGHSTFSHFFVRSRFRTISESGSCHCPIWENLASLCPAPVLYENSRWVWVLLLSRMKAIGESVFDRSILWGWARFTDNTYIYTLCGMWWPKEGKNCDKQTFLCSRNITVPSSSSWQDLKKATHDGGFA